MNKQELIDAVASATGVDRNKFDTNSALILSTRLNPRPTAREIWLYQ
jgi:hypothetical protein